MRKNDTCSCGSGKKFMECCIENNTATNNRMPRKYMSEFALHTYSSTVTMCYPNQLELIDTSEINYHIYTIHEIPRLSFVKEGIKILDDHIEVSIQLGVMENVNIKRLVVPLIKANHRETFTSYEFLGNKGVIFRDDFGGGIQTDVLTLYLNFSEEPLRSKVLYVGQSYGKKGERNAIQRLGSHSTLQKILADISQKSIEVEVD